MNPVVRVALLAIVLTGCKRHEPTAVSSGGTDTAPAATASADNAMPPGPPKLEPQDAVVVPDNGDINAVLDQLSTEFRIYVSRTRSRPKDFDDFVARAHVQAPPPPAGQSYKIADGKVVLVKK